MTAEKSLAPSVLDRLMDDDPRVGTPFLAPDDIKKPSALVAKLRDGSDPLSKYLSDQGLPDARELLERYDPSKQVSEDLLHRVVVGVNAVIQRGCIYDQVRFKGVRLPKEVMRLVEDTPRGVNVPYLNRMLIDEAYPNEIHKLRKLNQNYGVRQLKDDVARDLMALLNSRRELQAGAPEEFQELKGSLLEYGVPDFTAYSLVSAADRRRISREVEQAISQFEPRLKAPRVVLEPQQKFDQVLRFRIEALLQMDPAVEPVTFDAALHMTTCEYSVQGV
jgi:type VI secretion system protein ImpF